MPCISGLGTEANDKFMIKAVIFDIDGTLVDSVDFHAEAWQRALAEYGIEADFHATRKQIGKGADQFLPVFLSDKQIEEFGDALTERRGEIFQKEFLPRVKPFPKVRELFEHILNDGKRISLASSAVGEELEKYKELTNVSDLIEAATSADDAERSKPHPDIFAAALEKLGDVSVSEVVVIGDTPYDVAAANKIKIKSIGVLCGGFPESDIRIDGCIAIYKNPADLLANYETSPLAGFSSKVIQ